MQRTLCAKLSNLPQKRRTRFIKCKRGIWGLKVLLRVSGQLSFTEKLKLYTCTAFKLSPGGNGEDCPQWGMPALREAARCMLIMINWRRRSFQFDLHGFPHKPIIARYPSDFLRIQSLFYLWKNKNPSANLTSLNRNLIEVSEIQRPGCI